MLIISRVELDHGRPIRSHVSLKDAAHLLIVHRSRQHDPQPYRASSMFLVKLALVLVPWERIAQTYHLVDSVHD